MSFLDIFGSKKAHRMPKKAPYAKTKKKYQKSNSIDFLSFSFLFHLKKKKSVAYTVVYLCPFEIWHRKSKMAAN